MDSYGNIETSNIFTFILSQCQKCGKITEIETDGLYEKIEKR